MLSIGLIGFTGFGFTTADLIQDSTDHEIIADGADELVSVVAISFDSAIVIENDGVTVNRFTEKFKEADAVFNSVYKSELEKFEPDLNMEKVIPDIKPLPDQFRLKSKLKMPDEYAFRKARDGLQV